MKVTVYLRDMVTQHLGVYKDHDYGYGADQVYYMYSDGNYGCDCNRALFLARCNPAFAEALRSDPDREPFINDELTLPCRSDNRIKVDLIKGEDGEEIYRDAR